MIRLAAAGFQHETNSFAPRPTTHADFVRADSWPPLTEGAALRATMRGLNIPLAGFLAEAEVRGIPTAPLLWAAAEPAGEVTRDAFDRIAARLLDLLDRAGPVDGLYLDLHGAMIVEGARDGEAMLLRRVREAVGDLPVAVSLDHHAKVSPETAALADRIAIYRTYPHLDMAATGARCVAPLATMARGGPRPARALRHGAFLVPMTAQSTDRDPARRLYAEAEAAGVELAFGFPAGDTEWTGPAALAYADTQSEADSSADRLARALAASEGAFAADPPLPAAEAVRAALAAIGPGGPVVIADAADNPGGGGTADTMGVIRELIAQGARNAVAGLIHAPDAARRAHDAGPGASLSLALGCAHPWPGDAPLALSVEVVSTSDAPIAYVGEMYGGGHATVGRSAVLRVAAGCDLRLLVCEIPNQALDRGFFLHHGIDPAACTLVALKSSVHYRADFAPIARRIVEADAPGRLPADPSSLPFRHLRDGLRRAPRAGAARALCR